MKKFLIGAAMMTIASTGAAWADGHSTTVCLITKTDTNPFFVKMKEGAEAKAAELDMTLKSFAGKIDGDHETQVQAIETCILDGAKGILITASDTSSIVPAVQQARDAGLVVIALDTPLSPIDAADATFATDNFLAGELIGKWAAGQVDDTTTAKIGMMNINVSQPTVGVLRNQGFLQGFGIDLADPAKWGDESDERIINNEVTNANEEGGRKSMENLLTMDDGVNVLYTINEPAAAGAHETLKDFGKVDDVVVVSVDGGCPGVQAVAEGAIGATSQQYPLLMAALGVEAIKAWADDGIKPELTPGKAFFDTGVALVTDNPVDGVPSISSEEGLKLCWG